MIPIVIVGVVMATLGLALLFVGAAPLLPGKRIPAVRARVIGAILVGFLPMSLAAVLLCDLIFGRGVVEGPVVTWVMFAVCWAAIGALLFRVVIPKQDRSAGKSATPLPQKNPFADSPVSATPLPVEIVDDVPIQRKPAPRKAPSKHGAKPTERDPFDFS